MHPPEQAVHPLLGDSIKTVKQIQQKAGNFDRNCLPFLFVLITKEETLEKEFSFIFIA
jgi:hypothetical protein